MRQLLSKPLASSKSLRTDGLYVSFSTGVGAIPSFFIVGRRSVRSFARSVVGWSVGRFAFGEVRSQQDAFNTKRQLIVIHGVDFSAEGVTTNQPQRGFAAGASITTRGSPAMSSHRRKANTRRRACDEKVNRQRLESLERLWAAML